MSSQDRDQPRKVRRGREKCPDSVRTLIKRAMAMHLREHGNDDWDRVRERPEFAKWIGAESGEAGRRKFFRWKKSLSAPLPTSRTRPHAGRELNEEQQAWARDAAEGATGSALALSPRHLMANGGRALEGLHQLNAQLAEGFDDLERIRRVAFEADPNGHLGQVCVLPEVSLKTIRARCDLLKHAQDYLREYNAISAQEEFNEALVDLIHTTLASQPELRDELLSNLGRLVHDHFGAPARAP